MTCTLRLALLFTVFLLPLGCASTPKLEAVSDFDRHVRARHEGNRERAHGHRVAQAVCTAMA